MGIIEFLRDHTNLACNSGLSTYSSGVPEVTRHRNKYRWVSSYKTHNIVLHSVSNPSLLLEDTGDDVISIVLNVLKGFIVIESPRHILRAYILQKHYKWRRCIQLLEILPSEVDMVISKYMNMKLKKEDKIIIERYKDQGLIDQL